MKMSTEERKKFRRHRILVSLTIGTEWVFFRDGDNPKNTEDGFRDPWAGGEIRITDIKRDRLGRPQRFARLLVGPLMRRYFESQL